MPIIKKVRPTYGPQSKHGGHQKQSRGGQLLGVGICLIGLWGLAHIAMDSPQKAQAQMSAEGCPTATHASHGKTWNKPELRELAMAADEMAGNPAHTTPCAITQESRWNTRIVSDKGAIGIAQIMPASARSAGINPYDPEQAIPYMAKRLHGSIGKHHGSVAEALASYNGGDGGANWLARHGWHCDKKAKAGSYRRETAGYWKKITDCILSEQMKNG